MSTAKLNEKMTRDALETIGKVVDKYAHFPTQEARDAVVLWVAHTHVYDRFETTPRLGVYSSDYGSGKSQVLNLVAGMAPNKMNAVNVRPSMLYQAIESSDKLVFIIDEIDQIFGRRGSNGSHRQLQAVLNEGFDIENGKTMVTNGPETTREVSLFAPVATAGVGHVPDALKTRSIRIKLRKKPSDVELADYRTRKVRVEFNHVKDVLHQWARSCGPWLEFHFPELPVSDRAADKWESLATIAEMAGEDWFRRAKRACKLLESDDDESSEDVPLSVKLLRDIEEILEGFESEAIFTTELVDGLVEMGWEEVYVQPKALGKILGEYDVHSTTVRRGEDVAKGYYVGELEFATNSV